MAKVGVAAADVGASTLLSESSESPSCESERWVGSTKADATTAAAAFATSGCAEGIVNCGEGVVGASEVFAVSKGGDGALLGVPEIGTGIAGFAAVSIGGAGDSSVEVSAGSLVGNVIGRNAREVAGRATATGAEFVGSSAFGCACVEIESVALGGAVPDAPGGTAVGTTVCGAIVFCATSSVAIAAGKAGAACVTGNATTGVAADFAAGLEITLSMDVSGVGVGEEVSFGGGAALVCAGAGVEGEEVTCGWIAAELCRRCSVSSGLDAFGFDASADFSLGVATCGVAAACSCVA
jgi:hypothetical protein